MFFNLRARIAMTRTSTNNSKTRKPTDEPTAAPMAAPTLETLEPPDDAVQLLEATSVLLVPGAHRVHELAFTIENVPMGHAVQTAFASGAYPASQMVQLEPTYPIEQLGQL